MAKVHTLEIYPCTGARSCAGCFEASESAPPDDPAGEPAAAPPPAGETAPLPAEQVAPARALVEAHWEETRVPIGRDTPVVLVATADNIDDGTAASITVRDRSGRTLATLEASVSGGAIRVEWPPELGPDDAPEVIATVEAGGLTTTSDTLVLTSFVDVLVVDANEQPLPESDVEIVLADGTRRRLTSDAEGVVRIEDVAPGTYRLVVDVPEPAAAGAAGPPASAAP